MKTPMLGGVLVWSLFCRLCSRLKFAGLPFLSCIILGLLNLGDKIGHFFKDEQGEKSCEFLFSLVDLVLHYKDCEVNLSYPLIQKLVLCFQLDPSGSVSFDRGSQVLGIKLSKRTLKNSEKSSKDTKFEFNLIQASP